MNETRSQAILETVEQIKAAMAAGVTWENLQIAKDRLIALAKHTEYFPRSEFPIPTAEEVEKDYLIYSEPGLRNAIYVNVAAEGMSGRPHDHGDSWAVVASVFGHEKHYRYHVVEPGGGKLEEETSIVVTPGNAIAMLPGEIHAIEAVPDSEPLLFLHCYGLGFAQQLTRQEYDLAAETVEQSVSVGDIIKFPLTTADVHD